MAAKRSVTKRLVMKRLATGVLTLLAMVESRAAIAQPLVPMRLARQGGLSKHQFQQLKELDSFIALPMILPRGFSVVEFRAEINSGRIGSGPAYSIRYQHSHNGQCFVLEASSGGFGGPVPENRQLIRSPLNDPQASDWLYWSDGTSGEGAFPTPVVFSEWLQGQGELSYRIGSGMNFGTDCQRVSPELVTQVIESLDYINLLHPAPEDLAYLDPTLLKGMDEDKALYRAERSGYRLVRASIGQMILTNGSTDLILIRHPQTGTIESVMSVEAASSMCEPSIEQC